MAEAVPQPASPGMRAPELEDLRQLVETQLVQAFAPAPPNLAAFAEALEYSLLSPGKRIRPVLVLATAEACGGNVRRIAPAAAAFELVHAYSLVHDDLPSMDDDDLRRGAPTSHRRYGEATAVLVGDALQARAFAMVVGAVDAATPDVLVEVVRILADAAGWTGMVGGQYLDVAVDRDVDDLADLRDLHDRKTGALIAGAIEAGAVLAGAGDEVRSTARRFGAELGWLFQLVDDLLDEVGDAAATGKAVGTDSRHGKHTAVAGYEGVAGLRTAIDEQLARCLALAAGLPATGGRLPDIARFVHARNH